ncbi:DUF4258 domain-containing protein [Dictyobacter formicarum]|uniref:DUF1127 domain-containing protein n=1 Tax=Dictyobacter formicarum TaxID=2778368 RepID=A0ABQ3VGA8_9CHLR|nr:DUF4258 domain-containing protein [Dictyobacter formicarum]GHO85212.1 hypothetical protein KSZ_32180 [Dictyobacter formicarum]
MKSLKKVIRDLLQEALRQIFSSTSTPAFVISRFARQRMRDYGITQADIQDVLKNGEDFQPGLSRTQL